MPVIQPNPSVPVKVDPVTGQVNIPIDTASGVAVVAEAKASGNLYLVPAGKTFTGIAILMVGTGSGLVEIEDASDVVYHSSGGASKAVSYTHLHRLLSPAKRFTARGKVLTWTWLALRRWLSAWGFSMKRSTSGGIGRSSPNPL